MPAGPYLTMVSSATNLLPMRGQPIGAASWWGMPFEVADARSSGRSGEIVGSCKGVVDGGGNFVFKQVISDARRA